MNLETQFSIYKINLEKFVSINEIKYLSGKNRTRRILEIMLLEIRQEISQKKNSVQNQINVEGFAGITYRTVNEPEWDGMINDLFGKMNKTRSFDLLNVNVSYVLFYQIEESIYAMTAGYGNHLIKSYIERNWGLYLMPKILSDKEGVIREVKENNLYGNTLSVSKSNRNTTNISFEKKMSAVIRELSLEVDDNVKNMFGLTDKGKNSKTNMLLKDSLCFRKAFDINKLKNVLHELYEIEKKKDQYSMGYFLNSKKVGIKDSDLFDDVVECILRKENDKFTLIGDDYLSYCIGADEYIVTDEKGEVYWTSDEPILFNDLISCISEEKELSATYVRKVLKNWKISTKDNSGNDLLPSTTIFYAIQGFVEHGNSRIPCFLMQGEWYCLIERFTSILDEEFKERVNACEERIKVIKDSFGLQRSNIGNEDDYNDEFFDSDRMIVAHKSLVENFEVADLIFWDDESLYLMCNKKEFDASGSRDLTNQIWASANYLQSKLQSLDKNNFIRAYHNQILSRYEKNGYTLQIDQEVFETLFDKHIVFVAGYLFGYSIKSKSHYSKFLDVDTYKKMHDMGYEFFSMGISDEKKNRRF